MKKIFLSAAILVACAISASAKVVSKDTINYNGAYRLEKIEKTNDFGETNIRYIAVLEVNGKERKVTITKTTYLSGRIDSLIYNTDEDGKRTIAKAYNRKEGK